MSHESIPTFVTPAERRRLTWDCALAGVMILMQLAVLGYLSGARAFPLVMAAVTLWGVWSLHRVRLESTPLHLVYALMAIAFLWHYMVAPYPLPIDSPFIHSALAHSIARLLICVQVLHLFLQHPDDQMPLWIAALGAVTLSFATNLRAPKAMHYDLLVPISLFVVAFALYGGSVRRKVRAARSSSLLRRSILGAALLLIVSLGSGASWMLQTHERSIDWFLSEYLGYGGMKVQPGFTPNGRLDATSVWKQRGGEQIMLRIFADDEPGYLRGKAFDTYRGSTRDTFHTPWVTTWTDSRLTPLKADRDVAKARHGDSLYRIANGGAATLRTLDVWPTEGVAARIFTPLGTQIVGVPSGVLFKDGHGIVSLEDQTESVPYMVFANPVGFDGRDTLAAVNEDVDDSLLTSIDGPVDDAVRILATDLFAECRSSREKIETVERYFQSNYTYQLGIHVPGDMDAITYFLTERPAAHCEYFATGTAVLLRLANVPCRYVVGYVVREQNALGGFYVARNKDAHAWVEAYDVDAGEWVIVESTPSAGVPQERQPDWSQQLSESFRHRLSIWRMRLRDYGLRALWASLTDVAWSIPGLIVLMGIAVVLLVRVRPQFLLRPPRRRVPRRYLGMHQALARLDRQARRHGLQREPHETLSQFAERVRDSDADAGWKQAAADFYDRYAALRYQGDVGPETVQELRRVRSSGRS